MEWITTFNFVGCLSFKTRLIPRSDYDNLFIAAEDLQQ